MMIFNFMQHTIVSDRCARWPLYFVLVKYWSIFVKFYSQFYSLRRQKTFSLAILTMYAFLYCLL